MGCTYRCESCGAETTVVSQSTALDLLCGCSEDGKPMKYVGNSATEYIGHETAERDHKLL